MTSQTTNSAGPYDDTVDIRVFPYALGDTGYYFWRFVYESQTYSSFGFANTSSALEEARAVLSVLRRPFSSVVSFKDVPINE